MKNVIEFPKSKSKKVKSNKRSESRQAVIALSVVTLIMGFVLINDSMTKTERTSYLISDNSSQLGDLNRAIASAKPMNPFRDIEWEKGLAHKLGKETLGSERVPSSVGRQLTPLEELQVVTLDLKYSILNQPVGKTILIKEINYVDSQDVADEPERIQPEKFLRTYSDLWLVSFSRIESLPAPALKAEAADLNTQKIYRLYNDDNVAVGEATFIFDHEERFLSLKFRPISVP